MCDAGGRGRLRFCLAASAVDKSVTKASRLTPGRDRCCQPPTRIGKYGGLSRKPIRSCPWPRAISSAACDAVHRHEAELPHGRRVAGARDEHGAEPAERGLAARSSRGTAAADARCAPSGTPRSRARPPPRRAPRRRARAGRGPSRVAWKNVRYGCCVGCGEAPREPVEQDRGAAVDDRERVAPEAKREPEPEIRGEQRVRTLARQVRRHARDPDHERVERLVELGPPELHRPQQRLGMRDRRRPAERGRDRQLGSQRAQDVAAQHLRQRAVDVAEAASRRSAAARPGRTDSRATGPVVSG